jgi:hypothetical protein
MAGAQYGFCELVQHGMARAQQGHGMDMPWYCELALMVLFTKTVAAFKWDPSLSSNGIVSIEQDGCIEVRSFNVKKMYCFHRTQGLH